MICAPCREGGRLNQAASEHDTDWHRQAATRYHAECDGKCDCQHFIGEAINKQLVK